MAFQETIEYLFGLQKHGIKFGLSNSAALMERMGDPHRRFRSVHIAGTNGKGSTAAFLERMLRHAGYRVGLYTSPHLITFTERIQVDGEQISEAKVVELADRVRRCYAGHGSPAGADALSPTFFEVTTAMAFTYFAECSVDIAVVETGMGGRLDSTNVIAPLVSVITNIDLEHMEFLGPTVGAIAREKAGIIKQGVPVVTGAFQQEALAVLEEEAGRKGAPLYRMPADFGPEDLASGRPLRFRYRGMRRDLSGLSVGMIGAHQAGNASLALAAAECLSTAGVPIPEQAMRSGLADAAWPGRLEQVAARPDIYLDGAHNPASSAVLAEALRELRQGHGRVILVLGILQDKDYRGIIERLVPLADRVIASRPQYARAMDAGTLAAEVKHLHRDATAEEDLGRAVARARREASDNDLIVVTGSLYTVGDARALFLQQGKEDALRGLKG